MFTGDCVSPFTGRTTNAHGYMSINLNTRLGDRLFHKTWKSALGSLVPQDTCPLMLFGMCVCETIVTRRMAR